MKGATSSLLCRESLIKIHDSATAVASRFFMNVFNIFLIVGKFAKFVPEFCRTVFMIARIPSYHVSF